MLRPRLAKTFQTKNIYSSHTFRDLALPSSAGLTDLFIRIISRCANFQREYYRNTFMNFNFEPSFAGSRRLLRGFRAMSIVVAFCLLICATSARANQITTAPGFGPYQIGSGGEFTMITDAGVAAMLGGYSNGVTMNILGYPGSFQTFCAERNEYITAHTTYDVTLSSVTVFSARPLTIGAAYLYQQFATGQLMDYNFTDSPLGSRAGFNAVHGTAFELQRAIAYFMGEYPFDQYNIYMNGVVPLLPGADPFGTYTGTHVRILNLWAPGQPHDPAHAYQDVLVLTEAPEPSTFALASLGAAALLAFRRRK
jgi:hypothetical protein